MILSENLYSYVGFCFLAGIYVSDTEVQVIGLFMGVFSFWNILSGR